MCKCRCQCEATYKDPNQLEFTGFETRKHLKEKYDEGFETGINWDANWMPGGPWVNPNRPESRIAADQWHSGFLNGLAQRLTTNKHFAAWWDRNKGKTLNVNGATIDEVRYKDPESTNV